MSLALAVHCDAASLLGDSAPGVNQNPDLLQCMPVSVACSRGRILQDSGTEIMTHFSSTFSCALRISRSCAERSMREMTIEPETIEYMWGM